jgi:FlaA1/EpsC-like NDP-sugar epimerase
MKEAIDLTIYSLMNLKGGEIFVPKIPSFRIIDLAQAISKESKIKIIGIRPGEKIHEEMISAYDSINSVDMHKYYAILPDFLLKTYLKKNYKLVPKDFIYSSDKNNHFLKIEEIKKMIDQFRKNEIFIK